MSTASESSPVRGGGLIHNLSISRRKNSSNPSIISDNSDSNGLKTTLIEKAKAKLKGHDDDTNEGDNNGGGLKKLLSRGVGSKRRRQREKKDAEERDGEEAARGRSVAERGTLQNEDESNDNGGVSPVEGDRSSQITFEDGYGSETNNTDPIVRPPLSSHPSHSGYLTSSSPLINATVVGAVKQPQPTLDGVDLGTGSHIFPSQAYTLATAESAPALLTTKLQAPTESSSSRRSPSPVGRLREAFTPRRGPSTSPERKTGGGLGTFLQKDKNIASIEPRRGSVASRIGAIFPNKQIQEINSVPPTVATSTSSSPERPRTAKVPPPIETNVAPQTPPSAEKTAPLIVNTPPTPTDPGTPRFPSGSRERGTSEPTVVSNPNIVTSPSGNMLSHRRVRSNSAALGPSKLSNITSAPLTPTPENGSFTPGSSQQSGFFSTMFSAAQNAANTLTNSINNPLAPGDKNRTRNIAQESKVLEDVNGEIQSEKEESGDLTDEKELAVKTLGMGDLNFSHLGISEESSRGGTPTSVNFPDVQEQRGRSESNLREEFTLARPATITGDEFGSAFIPEDVGNLSRPKSMYEPALSVAGDHTPPGGSVFEGKSGIGRSGSVRSALGTGSRRKRGNSTATGATIAAAIAAANASVAHPNATGSAPKLTGFAVASKKRNRDFHQLFRSVPDDDYLIEDYSCALQREILAHGRLYVSEGHLCFSSNIFGWVTTLVMSFDEIVSVEKRSTALLFKNGLMISTLHAKNIFASFTSRDSTYDLIVGIWKLGHPSLRSSLNGVRIEETGGGDKTEKYDGPQSQSASEDEDDSDEEDVYDEDEEDEEGLSFSQNGEGSIVGSDLGDKIASRKPSAAVITTNGAPVEKPKENSPTMSAPDYPGPSAHAPTECTDQETHYDKVIADELIPAPLGKVYNLLFGPASVTWMSKWLTNEQKCLDLQMEDKKGLSLENKVRTYSYIKPLSGAIGPKQTKCIITETLDSMDLEKAISFTMSTQTPDVPSGNIFLTKTKYCLSWGEGNTTRMQMNCTIEWSGKSWLKGPIEKGANDGQVTYAKDIVAAIKQAVSARRSPTNLTANSSKKGKKGRKDRSAKSAQGKLNNSTNAKPPATESWGLFEPLHGPLGPVVDIVKPLFSGNLGYGLLVGLLVATWFGFGRTPMHGGGAGDRRAMMGYHYGTPERIAAYEELWRREESELWEWLEERVAMNRIVADAVGLGAEEIIERKTSLLGVGEEARAMEQKLREERIGEKELEIAIRVTEEKLGRLKDVVEKGKVTKAKATTREERILRGEVRN